MDRNIIISIKTVIFTALMIGTLYLMYLIKPILVTLVVALVIVLAIEHPVGWFMKQKIMNKTLSRSVSVIICYLLVLLSIVIVMTIGLPPVITQAQKLIVSIISIVREIPGLDRTNISFTSIISNISSVSQNFFTTTFSVFSGIAQIITLIIVSVYMSLDWENIKKKFYGLFNGSNRELAKKIVEEIEVSIGHWVKGQLILMLAVGAVSFVGLAAIGIEYPLALALVAGFTEIVPVLGPVIAMVFAVIISFSQSTTQGVLVVALFTLIQQLENSFLVPKVMHRVSGFSPLVILIALLVGSSLFGVIGAILAVPIMMIAVILIKHLSPYLFKTV